MAVVLDEWLGLIEREYLRDFVSQGGAAVKFAVGDADHLAAVTHGLRSQAAAHGLTHVALDAASTKLHMIHDVFFAISRTLDWDALAQQFMEALFARQGYQWPLPG